VIGNALLKLAVRLTELPTTSTVVTGEVLVVMTGAATVEQLIINARVTISNPMLMRQHRNGCIIVNTLNPRARQDFASAQKLRIGLQWEVYAQEGQRRYTLTR